MDNEDFHLASNKYASFVLKRGISVKTFLCPSFSSYFRFAQIVHSHTTIIIIIIILSLLHFSSVREA